MRRVLVLLFCLSLKSLSGQNLVPNDDFENYSSLPTTYGDWSKCNNWTNVNLGAGWPYSTPDYLHTSGSGGAGLPATTFGYVNPYSGNAIMGMAIYYPSSPNFREYVSVQLTSPMVVGTTYAVSFWITNGQSGWTCGGGCNHVGVKLSNGPLSQTDHEPILVTPEYEVPFELWSTTWVNFSFNYTPTTSLNYITIGNFYNDASTISTPHGSTSPGAYYFVDKVSIIADSTSLPPDPNLSISGPTQLCVGDSITLTGSGDTVYAWANSLTPSVIISNNPSITVSPSVTTTYLLYGSDTTLSYTVTANPYPTLSIGNNLTFCKGSEAILTANYQNAASVLWNTGSSNDTIHAAMAGQYWATVTNGCGTRSDTLIVTEQDCDVSIEFPNIFTPNNDPQNDLFLPFNMKGIVQGSMKIYNRWGQLLYETDDLLNGWNGKHGSRDCPDDVYYWLLTYTDKNGKAGEKHGFLTLLR